MPQTVRVEPVKEGGSELVIVRHRSLSRDRRSPTRDLNEVNKADEQQQEQAATLKIDAPIQPAPVETPAEKEPDL